MGAGDGHVHLAVTRPATGLFDDPRPSAHCCSSRLFHLVPFPDLASAIGHNADRCFDGETGFVVPPKNVEALSRAIKTFAEKPEMLARFKEQGVYRVHELFSLERMLSETEKIYCMVMKGIK